jgi:hypothetical protein
MAAVRSTRCAGRGRIGPTSSGIEPQFGIMTDEIIMGRSILLLLVGVPIPIIILIALLQY